ncbi:alanine-synthesizing transaminase [Ferrithrix thermotolerans DSM 19514]|uniref:Alanine-synthesizing transaminase n=1 Tax=Ferrithrix thermotolerans DSM 19514 TaxID=1121881 RepID=A0A1M4UNE6_9ACTN|nr:aminotransferase class I/II-fold pyridoxal phosphate-dependent enzyme [Ferrithrix thermotolerans]SHE58236.1 alanine-synthesizing transaminase [Ferrithrix thermotolerans DSM 19514]
MQFRRIESIPPYVFSVVDGKKREARRLGRDVIDLGFGNPDIPSPDVAVDKLAEAARNPRNHRYSVSRGIPNLRAAIADRYKALYGCDLDPDTEVVATIGAKEGLSHLMWVLLGSGDVALVPSPSYPIHIWAPLFAGAEVVQVPLGVSLSGELSPEEEFFDRLIESYEASWPRPRVVIVSFPHNPTTTCVDLAWMTRLVEFAKERDVVLVHDFAYSDTYFDGLKPPSILQVPGAKDVAVELYTLTKSFSMAGWRVGFMVGNAEICQALAKMKSYLDYGTFQPIQIAATVTLKEAQDYPDEVRRIYTQRRDALCDGLDRIGWHIDRPKGTMFVWAEIPKRYEHMSSLEFASFMIDEADVAVSPGVGFGPGGDRHVRFALIENEQRIAQAVRNLKRLAL